MLDERRKVKRVPPRVPLWGSRQCIKTKAIVEKQEMRVIETTMEKCYNMLERKE